MCALPTRWSWSLLFWSFFGLAVTESWSFFSLSAFPVVRIIHFANVPMFLFFFALRVHRQIMFTGRFCASSGRLGETVLY